MFTNFHRTTRKYGRFLFLIIYVIIQKLTKRISLVENALAKSSTVSSIVDTGRLDVVRRLDSWSFHGASSLR